MRTIVSRDNPHFRALKKLGQSGRERRKAGRIVLDGMHLVEAYTQRFGIPDELVVSRTGAGREEIASYLARSASCRLVNVLSDALFDELAPVETPSGILAIVAQPQCVSGPEPKADTVVLDGVQDPGNVGSILRSAAAAGFRQILLSSDCAQAWSPKTLRAAMGAHFLLDIHEAVDLPAFLKSYRGQAVLTSLEASDELYALNLKQPVAWVFGSEGHGVRADVRASVPLQALIPMLSATESLNVAAAAAVCLFETVRQRR